MRSGNVPVASLMKAGVVARPWLSVVTMPRRYQVRPMPTDTATGVERRNPDNATRMVAPRVVATLGATDSLREAGRTV